MILAYHAVFGAYGFWLPNDPRGSWSDFVGSWELLRFGPASKVTTTRSLAAAEHDRTLRLAAKQALHFPPVHFTGRQALAVAHGFDRARREGGYRLHACSILPEHVHLVLGRHERRIGQIVGHLKGRATQALFAERQWPAEEQPVWAEGGWKVFLDNADAVYRAIAYVEENPVKEGKPCQRWSFVEPFVPPPEID